MLFKNIGLIDENFEYKENMYGGTNCHRIVYIDSEPPKNEEAFFETYDGKGKVLHTQDSSFLEEGKGYSKDKVVRFFKNWTPKAVQGE